jgi:hypothetical protein
MWEEKLFSTSSTLANNQDVGVKVPSIRDKWT